MITRFFFVALALIALNLYFACQRDQFIIEQLRRKLDHDVLAMSKTLQMMRLPCLPPLP